MGIQGQEFDNTVYAVTEQRSTHLGKKKEKSQLGFGHLCYMNSRHAFDI